MIAGLEIRATTVAITADLLLEVEDSDGGGGGSAIRSDDCEISTDTPRKPKCSSFETNSPFEVVFNESMFVDAEKSSDASFTTSTKSLSANASNFLRLPLELIATNDYCCHRNLRDICDRFTKLFLFSHQTKTH